MSAVFSLRGPCGTSQRRRHHRRQRPNISSAPYLPTSQRAHWRRRGRSHQPAPCLPDRTSVNMGMTGGSGPARGRWGRRAGWGERKREAEESGWGAGSEGEPQPSPSRPTPTPRRASPCARTGARAHFGLNSVRSWEGLCAHGRSGGIVSKKRLMSYPKLQIIKNKFLPIVSWCLELL